MCLLPDFLPDIDKPLPYFVLLFVFEIASNFAWSKYLLKNE
jgi:hypothetical protein